MPEKEDPEEEAKDKEESRKDPNNEGEAHARKGEGFAVVLLSKGLDLLKEAGNGAFDGLGANGQFRFVDSLDGKGVDNLTRPRANDDTDPCYHQVSRAFLAENNEYQH